MDGCPLRPSPRPSRSRVDGAESYRQADGRGCNPGFTVRLHPETEHGRVRAIMSIAVEGRRAQAVMRACTAFPKWKPCTPQTGVGTWWRSFRPQTSRPSAARWMRSAKSTASPPARPACCSRAAGFETAEVTFQKPRVRRREEFKEAAANDAATGFQSSGKRS